MHARVFEKKSLWRRTGRHRRRGPTFGVVRMKIGFGRIVAQSDSGIEENSNPRNDTLNRSVRSSFSHQFSLLKANTKFSRTQRKVLSRPSFKSPPIVIICRRKANVEHHDQSRDSHTDVHQGERSAYATIGTCAKKVRGRTE